MTTDTVFPASAGQTSDRSSRSANFTYTEAERSSWYSISASASAVWQVKHQWMGFLLRMRSPESPNFMHSRAMTASYG